VHGHRYVPRPRPPAAGSPLTSADFGDKKITVNAVAPGGIKTDMYHAGEPGELPRGRVPY